MTTRYGIGKKIFTPGSILSQFGNILKIRERLGLGERLHVIHRPAVNDIAHRKFHDLAALGRGDVGYLDDLGRHVARRSVAPDLSLDAACQSLIEPGPLAQPDEEHNP